MINTDLWVGGPSTALQNNKIIMIDYNCYGFAADPHKPRWVVPWASPVPSHVGSGWTRDRQIGTLCRSVCCKLPGVPTRDTAGSMRLHRAVKRDR